MIMLDLDHFRRINDDFGAAAGDTVLKTVALRLRAATPDEWVLARWGGEEFLALGLVESSEQARKFAECLRQAISIPPMELNTDEGIARQILVTASIGVSVQLAHARKPWEEQLSAADRALYRVKRTGRNRIELAVFGT